MLGCLELGRKGERGICVGNVITLPIKLCVSIFLFDDGRANYDTMTTIVAID